ncbi:MAG: beta-galactosidase [Candidatus Dormibacteraceae bacterium]
MTEPAAFTYGAQYYRPPNPPRQDWRRDLGLMREHGFNTVKFWACWSWIAGRPGEMDFSELDALMDLAATEGLKVVVNVILENAPYWLERRHPEARYRAHDGMEVQMTAAINTPGGGWPGLCFDNRAVREAGTEFLEATVRRYRDHPALAVWDVWNEPHLEPSWYYPDRMFCYCDASVSLFRAWARNRYPGIDSLNAVWARRYSDWHEVLPPRAFETYPDLIDWRTFWLENLAGWLGWKIEAVKRIDSQHPVMTHVASSGYQGTLATNSWDEWLLSRSVDMFGTSSFPRWLMDGDPALHLFHLDATRDAARGKVFWQSELQGGRGRRDGRRGSSHPDAAEIRMWVWNVLAAGAKGCLFWQWRPELLGPEAPGYGLCTAGGQPTDRSAAAMEMGSLVADFPELAGSRPLQPRAGLLVSRQTALLSFAADRDMDLYAASLRGAYRAFFDQDVPVRFVHEDLLAESGVPAGIEYLYWPMPLMTGEAVAKALVEFVAAGGTLAAEAGPAQHARGGWSSTVVPGLGLDRLFGAREIESDHCPEVAVHQGNGRTIFGAWQVGRLRATSAEVTGTFADGSPAALVHAHGRGRALLIGTHPSLAYESSREAGTGAWIAGRDECRLGRVEQTPVAPGLVTRLHESGQALLLFALNWGSVPARSNLDIRDVDIDLVRASVGLELVGGGLEVSLEPLRGAVAVIQVKPAPGKPGPGKPGPGGRAP